MMTHVIHKGAVVESNCYLMGTKCAPKSLIRQHGIIFTGRKRFFESKEYIGDDDDDNNYDYRKENWMSEFHV